jgi:hypothetical protein
MTASHDVEALLAATIDSAREQLGERLRSAYAIGSLGHGGFVRQVSDVDVALVLDTLTAADADLGPRLARATRDHVADPLAERLSIFWCDWDRLEAGSYEAGRFPAPDRLDLAQSGRHLFGAERRERVKLPTHDELVVAAAGFAVEKLGGPETLAWLRDPASLAPAGARTVTKTVLFPVRFRYTAATGRVGSNDGAADWYASEGDRPGRELVAAAAAWRTSGLPGGTRCAELLDRHLRAVYDAFLADYAERLDALGRRDLAEALAGFGVSSRSVR